MRPLLISWSVLGVLSLSLTVLRAEAPTAEYVLSKFTPRQRDVEIETPKPAEFAKCTVKPEKFGKGSAWTVSGPNGQVLRRFVDTNNDTQVDQWRYYNNGIEVYREVDSNFNEKPDQFRWLNMGGSRWGVDTNNDMVIDEWRLLSAEEASRVAVNALLAGDADALRQVLITSEDCERLKIDATVAKALLANVANPAPRLRETLSKTKSLTPRARWMRFDVASAMPSVIPADDGKADIDLLLYENAMAIVETEGTPPKNSLLIQIGELVKVGDVWKLTQIPLPIEGNQVQLAAGVLMTPSASANESSTTQTPSGNVDPKIQELVKQIQELDAKAPSSEASPAAFAKFSMQRAAILKQLVSSTKGADQEPWFKQLVDGLASAVQTGAYDDGLQELKVIEKQVQSQAKGTSPLLPYVVYRRMVAEYSSSVQQAKGSAAQAKVQEDWNKDLQDFVERFPKGEDAPDAMMQLATGLEFSGRAGDARKWFKELAESHPKSLAGRKAAGAITRLDSKGKPLPLSFAALDGGKVELRSYRGKAVLVVFWATWCKPCSEDLPKLREFYKQYRSQGFEVIGVNLDSQQNLVKPYLAKNEMTWPQIFEPGGLESSPSLAFGVISLPTMFLVDKDGLVHSRPASMDDVKISLPEVLGLKKPMANAGGTKN